MKRLWKYAVALTALSFVGFGLAIAFKESNSPLLVAVVYVAAGILLVAIALAVFAISLIGADHQT